MSRSRPIVFLLSIAIAMAVAASTFSSQGQLAAPGPSCGFDTTVDFGGKVVIGQDIMLVRVWKQPTATTTPYIEIRRHVDGSWPVIQTITPGPGNKKDSWGTAMATDGRTIVIGDFDADWGGFGRNGVVTVYRRQGNSFSLDAHITAPTTCTFLMFGGGVAVDKDTLVVTRPNNTETCGLTVPRREAYIYKRVNSTWTYMQSVLPPAVGPEPTFFGRSIVASCDHLFIGSQGRVFQYFFNGTMWQYVGFLDPPGSGSDFGVTMSGAGKFVAIGDPNFSLEGTPIRAVYIYEDSPLPGTHVLRNTVLSPDGPLHPFFGYAVALAGETLLVGASSNEEVYVYQKNPSSNAWNFTMELTDPHSSTHGTYVAAGPNVMTAASGEWCNIYTCTAGVGGFNGCGDGDLDGDSLLDEWETLGIPTGDAQVPRFVLDADGDGQGDANYQHKDIFVEVEAVPGYHPPAGSLGKVIDAFDAVSNDLVKNPDGQPGINLHLQLDDWNLPDLEWTEDDLDGDGNLDWPGEFDQLKLTYPSGGSIPGYFGTASERTLPAATAAAIREARRKAFRYCIFGRSENPRDTTSGAAEIGGNDFYVTLGLWKNGGTPDQHAGTFMHELGHTLGLQHGGSDSTRYKPNYYSVMNYIWQTPKPWFLPYQWPLADGRPGYSPAAIPTLNEAALPNCQPVIDLRSPMAGISFPFNRNPHGEAQSVVVITRNFEGDVDWTGGDCEVSGAVAIDLNRLTSRQTSAVNVHVGFADWPALSFDFRADAEYADGIHQGAEGEEELTEAHDAELQAILPAHCHGDLTGDRTVNVADLLQVISNWGSCLPPCSADIAPPGWPDHQVNVADLLQVIGVWGPCG